MHIWHKSNFNQIHSVWAQIKIQKNILISHDITSDEGRRLEKNEKPEKNELKN